MDLLVTSQPTCLGTEIPLKPINKEIEGQNRCDEGVPDLDLE